MTMMKLLVIIISSLTLTSLYCTWVFKSLNDIVDHQEPEWQRKQRLEEQKQKRRRHEESADAIYHDVPIFYRDHPPPRTRVHCIGGNLFETRWMFQSCEYQRYCLDVSKGEWVVFLQDPVLPMDDEWDGHTGSSTNPRSGDLYTAGGPQPKTWFNPRQRQVRVKGGIGALRPGQVEQLPASYYEFPPQTTVVHYHRHPKSHQNPGHLVWDDFLSIYTLLDIFDRIEGSSAHSTIILALQKRPVAPPLNVVPYSKDSDLLFKFLPLWGDRVQLMDMSSLNQTTTITNLRSKYICAPIGLNGNGLFSDHGHDHWHGQVFDDYSRPHNLGRGASFRRFRQFLWNNVSPGADRSITKPYQIVVSVDSSTKKDRSGINFDEQISALERKFPKARIHPVSVAKLSLEEQLALVQNAAIYITTVGGGSVTGFFMPSNANVILYPVRPFLDWDLWNNVGDLRVHWMPQIGQNVTDIGLTGTQGQYSTDYLLRLVGRLLEELEE